MFHQDQKEMLIIVYMFKPIKETGERKREKLRDGINIHPDGWDASLTKKKKNTGANEIAVTRT